MPRLSPEVNELNSGVRPDRSERSPNGGRSSRIWTERDFRTEMTRVNASDIESFDVLAARLRCNPRLELRLNGSGKAATCKVALKDTDSHVLWIYADGRLQWCWESFRSTRPDVVTLFQGLVESRNQSIQEWKGKPLVEMGADAILAVLKKVADIAR